MNLEQANKIVNIATVYSSLQKEFRAVTGSDLTTPQILIDNLNYANGYIEATKITKEVKSEEVK